MVGLFWECDLGLLSLLPRHSPSLLGPIRKETVVVTEILNAREASNRWYGALTEDNYQNTVDDFVTFLEQEALPEVPSGEQSKFLDGLKRWIPDQKATIESFRSPRPST